MFEKLALRRRIRVLEDRILFFEKKRERSQGSLVEAILKGTEPHDEDVDYFNRYTENIDSVRKELRNVREQLEALNNAKKR